MLPGESVVDYCSSHAPVYGSTISVLIFIYTFLLIEVLRAISFTLFLDCLSAEPY